MNLKHSLVGAAFFAAAGFTAANAAPVDLSSWVAEGGGVWELQPGNNSVLQSANGDPTVFHNNMNSQGLELSGVIEVQTVFDDDVIGFVLGYNSGDLTNPTPNYILIDWRQVETPLNIGGCDARPGLSAMRITGDIGDRSGLICRDGSEGVTELARGMVRGDTGWADNTEYRFDLIFTASLIQVFINGDLEFNLAGTFADGAFGFYNFSQGGVSYAGIQDVADPQPIPLPAAAPLMAFALGAGAFLRRLRRKRAQ